MRLSCVADRYGLPPYAATRFLTVHRRRLSRLVACGSVLALKLGVARAIVRFPLLASQLSSYKGAVPIRAAVAGDALMANTLIIALSSCVTGRSLLLAGSRHGHIDEQPRTGRAKTSFDPAFVGLSV